MARKKNPFDLLNEAIAALRACGMTNDDVGAVLRITVQKMNDERWVSLNTGDAALVVRECGDVEVYHADIELEMGERPTAGQTMLLVLEDKFWDKRMIDLIRTFQSELGDTTSMH